MLTIYHLETSRSERIVWLMSSTSFTATPVADSPRHRTILRTRVTSIGFTSPKAA